MKLLRLLLLAALASAQVPLGSIWHRSGGGSSISVTNPGHGLTPAACDGVTDDENAIQGAMNYANANHISRVLIPGRTCLLDSYVDIGGGSSMNLSVPSNVTLEGVAGSRLLQGPRGRIPTSGGNYVFAYTLNVGNPYSPSYQIGGPFFNLNSIPAGASSISFVAPADSNNFAPGDYVAIYEQNPACCDVQPALMSQVASVSSGQIMIIDKMPWAFGSHVPVVANVTAKTVAHAGVKNLTIQGASTLSLMQVFYLDMENCTFIADVSTISSGAGTWLVLHQVNTVEHSTFRGNTFTTTAPAVGWGAELPQRDSGNDLWVNNTFGDAQGNGYSSWGFAEFTNNITLRGNHFWTNPDGYAACGVIPSGINIVFDGNDVHTNGDWKGGSPLCDFLPIGNVWTYIYNIQITNNTIQCVSSGGQCMLLAASGDKVVGNTINASGSAMGIHANAYAYDTEIRNNQIHVSSGRNGVWLDRLGGPDNWHIDGNSVAQIVVNDYPYAGGSCSIQNNQGLTGGYYTPANHMCALGGNGRARLQRPPARYRRIGGIPPVTRTR